MQHSTRLENIFVLDPQEAAFVIIDMQNFSCAPATRSPLPHLVTVITRINRLADFCREMDVPVIWVRQNLTYTGSRNAAGLYPLFHDDNHTRRAMNRCEGTEVSSDMHLDASRDHVVSKNRYSACLSNSPMNWQTWSNVAFAFKPTPLILVARLSFALLMGLIGGLQPAIREL